MNATPLPGQPDEPALPPTAGGRVLRRVAAALYHRDFRILWSGAFLSTIGTWVQRVAQSWLVLTLSGSAFYLGLDAFLGELPLLLFTLLGGVVADRHDRRRLLLGSQYVQMTCAFVLAALVFTGVVKVPHILVLSFVTGLAQAFGGPAYQSLIPSLVTTKDLPNAIALNSIQYNLARLIGPVIAGWTLARLGTAGCFTANGLSFLVVIVALMMLRVEHVPPSSRQPLLDELKVGLRFVRARHALVALTLLAFLSAFLGLPVLTLLPVMAQHVFHEGVGRYTQMMACAGAGAVTGALVVAWLGRFRRMGLTLLLTQAALAVLVVLFARVRMLPLSFVLLFLCGAALIIVFSLLTSLVQLIAPNDMRGRVMSVYMMAFRGGAPLGSLASGTLASLTSATAVLTIAGVLLAAVAVWFLARDPHVRDL